MSHYPVVRPVRHETDNNVSLYQQWQGMMVGTRISTHPPKKRKDTRAEWQDPGSQRNAYDIWDKAATLMTGTDIGHATDKGPRLRITGHLVVDQASIEYEEPPLPEPVPSALPVVANAAQALAMSGVDVSEDPLARAWLAAAMTNSDAVSQEAIQEFIAARAVKALEEQAERAPEQKRLQIPVGNLKHLQKGIEPEPEAPAQPLDDKPWTWEPVEESLDPEHRAKREAALKEQAKAASELAMKSAEAASTAAAAWAERRQDDSSAAGPASSKHLSDAFMLSDKPSTAPEFTRERPQSGGTVTLGNIPRGADDDSIWAECLKYGKVASIYYESESQFALVKYIDYDNAVTAVEHMLRAKSLFGAHPPHGVEVKLVTATDMQRAEKQCEAFDPENAEHYDFADAGGGGVDEQERTADGEAKPRRRRRRRRTADGGDAPVDPAALPDLFDEARVRKHQRAAARSHSSGEDESVDSHDRRRNQKRRRRRTNLHGWEPDEDDARPKTAPSGVVVPPPADGPGPVSRPTTKPMGVVVPPPPQQGMPVSITETVRSAAFPPLPMTGVLPIPPGHEPVQKDFKVSFPPTGPSGYIGAHGLSLAPAAGFRSAEVRFNRSEHAFAAVNAAGLVLHGRVLNLSLDASSKDGSKVIVKGIAPGTHWIELKTLFAQIGPVAFVQIKEDPSQPG